MRVFILSTFSILLSFSAFAGEELTVSIAQSEQRAAQHCEETTAQDYALGTGRVIHSQRIASRSQTIAQAVICARESQSSQFVSSEDWDYVIAYSPSSYDSAVRFCVAPPEDYGRPSGRVVGIPRTFDWERSRGFKLYTVICRLPKATGE